MSTYTEIYFKSKLDSHLILDSETLVYRDLCNMCENDINDDVLYEPDKKVVDILSTYKFDINNIIDYYNKINNNKFKCTCYNSNNIQCLPQCNGCSNKKVRLMKYFQVIKLCMEYEGQIKIDNIVIYFTSFFINEKNYRYNSYNNLLKKTMIYLPERQCKYIIKKIINI